MNLLRHITYTLMASVFCLMLLPLILIVFAVAGWRIANVVSSARGQRPIDGEFTRHQSYTLRRAASNVSYQ
jgi:hypothetical protein